LLLRHRRAGLFHGDDVIEERRRALSRFMQSLLKDRASMLAPGGMVRRFLGLDSLLSILLASGPG